MKKKTGQFPARLPAVRMTQSQRDDIQRVVEAEEASINEVARVLLRMGLAAWEKGKR